MFLLVSVILLTGRGMVCLSACWEQTPPLGAHSDGSRPPQKQTPPRSRHPPRVDTPQADTPRKQTPPEADTPRSRPPRSTHPPKADSGIRSMSGWYASYWNAFLSENIMPEKSDQNLGKIVPLKLYLKA